MFTVSVPTLYCGVPLYTGDGLVLAEVEVSERLVLLSQTKCFMDQQALGVI